MKTRDSRVDVPVLVQVVPAKSAGTVKESSSKIQSLSFPFRSDDPRDISSATTRLTVAGTTIKRYHGGIFVDRSSSGCCRLPLRRGRRNYKSPSDYCE